VTIQPGNPQPSTNLAPKSQPEPQPTLHEPKPQEAIFPLVLANAGEDVIIAAIRGGKGLNRKLMELGLRVGVTVTILQKHAGRFILAHDGQRTALGSGMSQKLFVSLPASQKQEQ